MLHDEMWHMCNVVSTACVNNYEVTHSVYIHTQQKPRSRDSSDSIIAAGTEFYSEIYTTTTTAILWPFFGDRPGEPVPEENFWTLWSKERLTEVDTPTIRLGAIPSGLTSTHLLHHTHFLQAGCPSCGPTNSAKALK